jgi:uncharacterized protein YgiM (DUF1202 family)
MYYRVEKKHQRSFDEAPKVQAGEVVRFLWEDEKNPGWFFGETFGGTEGFFPNRWFEVRLEAQEATALRDYNAMELTVDKGEIVEAIDEAAGWLLVKTADHRTGWIPRANVEESP